jgi:hypothetical protein
LSFFALRAEFNWLNRISVLRWRCIPLDEQVSDGVEHPKLEICHFVQQPDNVLLDLVPVHGRLPPLSSWCFWDWTKGSLSPNFLPLVLCLG